MRFGPSPVLTPEDLGIVLEEDSSDLTAEEAAGAVDTSSAEDLSTKVSEFVREAGSGVIHHELRRRAGILFSRIRYEDGPSRLFQVEWLRRGL